MYVSVGFCKVEVMLLTFRWGVCVAISTPTTYCEKYIGRKPPIEYS